MDIESPPPSPTLKPVSSSRRKFSGRRLDRLFCDIIRYFPLLLVYSGTAWALYTASWAICFRLIRGFEGSPPPEVEESKNIADGKHRESYGLGGSGAICSSKLVVYICSVRISRIADGKCK